MFLVLAYVLSFFVVSRFDIVHGGNVIAFASTIAMAWGFLHWALPQPGGPTKWDRRATVAALLVIGIPGVALFIVTWPGYVLIGHDPLIVPTLAQALRSHATTMDVYQPGDPGFTYPPGYPILFSNILALLPTPLQALIIFKVWTVLLLLLLPLGWAWMAHRVFLVPLPFWSILLLSYLAAFGLERTTVLALLPGKNAQILAGAMFPFVVGLMLVTQRAWLGLPFAVASLGGAILVHYSMFYMFVTFFAAYIIIHFPRNREDWLASLRLGLAGILSLSMFVLLMGTSFNDPRAGAFGWPRPLEVAPRMAAVLLARHDELLFIFNGPDFNVYRSPYRGLLLVGCVVLCVAIAYLVRAVHERSFAVARMAAVWGIMLLIGIAFDTGALQVGITYDFTRWYLIFPQTALMLAALCALVVYARAAQSGKLVAYSTLGGLAVVAATMATSDLAWIARAFRAQRVSHGDLTNVRDGLTAASPLHHHDGSRLVGNQWLDLVRVDIAS